MTSDPNNADDFSGDIDPSLSYETVPDFEPEAPETECEPVAVPANADMSAPRVSVPRARRELNDHLELVKSALVELTELHHGVSVQLGPIAIDLMACGGHDLQYPLDGNALSEKLRVRARSGSLDGHVRLAIDESEDVLTTLEAALAALKAISVLDEPIPQVWGNLHPLLLARKLNVLGHTLLRGRIAGVNL